MVGKVPAIQLGDPGSILGGVRNFNFYPGTGCVCPLFVFCPVLYDGGPDIVLTTRSGRSAVVFLSSVLVHSLLLPYRHLNQDFGFYVPGVLNPTLGEGK